MALLLGIDLGTSYLKAGVFDESGTLRGMGRVSTGVREPRPGWKELDVAEFLQHLREAVGAALGECGSVASEIKAISYGSQANTFVLLDERGQPITVRADEFDTRAGGERGAQRLLHDTGPRDQGDWHGWVLGRGFAHGKWASQRRLESHGDDADQADGWMLTILGAGASRR